MVITQITPLGKGKSEVCLEGAQGRVTLALYNSEMKQFGMADGQEMADDAYMQLYHGVVGKRAIRRAMHLLEKMDRTEQQLLRKLLEGGYPQDLAENAVAYVKSYHYIDDERYARTFVRLNQQGRSRRRLKMDLLARGITAEIAELAIEEENETSQEELIQKLLDKKHYSPDTASWQETAKMLRFLQGKGFRNEEIMHVLGVHGR